MGSAASRAHRFLIIMSAIALLWANPFYTATVKAEQGAISIGNNLIEVSFKAQASLEITSVRNGFTGVEYVFSGSQIFVIVLFDKTTGEQPCFGSSNAVNYNYQLFEDGKILIVKYRGFRTYRFFNINVTLTITVSSGPEVMFSITVDKEEKTDIYYIMYPVIDGITKLGSRKDSTFLVIPSWGGTLVISDPTRFCCPGYPAHPYPTGEQNLQFMSLFDGEGAGSLYVYTSDTYGFYKSFKWEGRDLGLMSVMHYPEFRSLGAYSPPYSVILGVSDARDWRSSVEPYKKWASKQWWSQSKKEDSWLRGTHLIVYNTAYLQTPRTSNVSWRHVSFEDIVDAAKEENTFVQWHYSFLYKRLGETWTLHIISGCLPSKGRLGRASEACGRTA